MTQITCEQLVEIRDKYLRGLQSIDAQIERLRSDRAATEGAAQAIATVIDELNKQRRAKKRSDPFKTRVADQKRSPRTTVDRRENVVALDDPRLDRGDEPCGLEAQLTCKQEPVPGHDPPRAKRIPARGEADAHR